MKHSLQILLLVRTNELCVLNDFRIFSYLDILALCRCAQVSKFWNVLALDGSNWQHVDLFTFQRDIEVSHLCVSRKFFWTGLLKSWLSQILNTIFDYSVKYWFFLEFSSEWSKHLCRYWQWFQSRVQQTQYILHKFMAQYSLFMLKVPWNTNLLVQE